MFSPSSNSNTQVTVGTGGNAVNPFEVLNDQRGLSFSGGGSL